MEMEESFSAQDPEFLSSAGSGVDLQPDTEQVETISEDSAQLSIEAASVSSEPNQVTADLGRVYSQLAFITFRRQLLHNRRIMLLKMQQFRNKRKDREGESSGQDNHKSGAMGESNRQIAHTRVHTQT